jgi:hypothetical protein
MLRLLGFILAIYIVGFAVVDSLWFDGRYSRAVLQQVSYRAYRVTIEVRYQLDKMAHASNFAVPSRADDRR